MTLEGKEAGGGGVTDWPALERRKDCGEGRSMSADRWRKGGAVRPPVRSEGRRSLRGGRQKAAGCGCEQQWGGGTREAAWGANMRSPNTSAEKPFLNCFCLWCTIHTLTLGHLPRAPRTGAKVSVCVGVTPLTENENNLAFTLLLCFIITFSIYSFVYAVLFYKN